MSSSRVPGRTLRRRFTLGSGPLKRTSDRVEFASRVLLLLALLLAAPVGLLAGAATYSGVLVTARHEAATRSTETATLLGDAPRSDTVEYVAVLATWTTQAGIGRSGLVEAPTGSPAGTSVDVWVDPAGRITDRPLTHGEVVGQGVVVGAVAVLGVVIAAMSCHLVVLLQLEGRRNRRWAAGWASVEPLWVSRFR